MTDPGSIVDGSVSWRELRAETAQRLTARGFETGRIEAAWLVEEASGLAETELDAPATERRLAHLDAMIARRLAGEPIQYVLGRWAFRSLDLMVDRRVLIPRPETELLAGLALAELVRCPAEAPVAVDLGTGSGAVALALAAEHDAVRVWAGDADADAIAVARANTAALGRRGGRVTLVEGSWFDPLPADLRGGVDVVVSNPPYVAVGESLPAEVSTWEPESALRSGPAGLDDLAEVVGGVAPWLRPGGAVLVEHGAGQADAVAALADAAGLVAIEHHRDLAGRPRVLAARRPG